MTDAQSHEKLLDFLDTKAFRPVMDAKTQDYPQSKRDTLRYVQDRSRQGIDRFHGYQSARDVVSNFHRDRSSHPARKVPTALHDLGLPTVNDMGKEFDRLAQPLGVT